MRLTKPALNALLLFTTLGAPQLALSQSKGLATEMWASDQPPQLTTATAPTLKVYSRETIVDVLVTDEKGQPVRGLKQTDFTISEDGQPQPLRSFAEFDLADRPAAPPRPKLPPNVYTNYQLTPATGPVNILLIDALHSSPVDAVLSLRAAEQYILAMPAGTQLAVFWLADSGLHMLQGFTTDPALLLRAVRTNRVDIGKNGDDRYTVDKLTIASLNQIAAYVSAIKGRKNLLWMAPGPPIILVRDGGYGWHDQDTTRVHRVMDTYELFTAEQIAVSPIDSRGVRYCPGRPCALDFSTLQAEAIAEGTGGEAFYNNNDLKALLSQAIGDGSHFYTLSYIPPRQVDDGHYHTIKVETIRPGLHLVYRAGYNSEDPPRLPQHSGADLLNTAMQGNAPAATQLLFDVQAVPSAQPEKASSTDKAAIPYDVLYLLPQSQIAFASAPDGAHKVSFEFHAAAYDIYGRLVASINETLNLPLSPGEYREFVKTPFQFSQQLDLPPGQISLRVGILDTTSNKVGTLEVPLIVSKTPDKHGAAPPPAIPTPCPPRCVLPTPPPATPAP
ncbi:MAG: VWA domain-containing protein [Acidobacteriaceae bacterium]|jgi:VWFA-related protein